MPTRIATAMAMPPSVSVTGRRRASSPGHRPARPQRLSEVAARDLADPLGVLHGHRAVEPELGPELVQVLAVGLLLQHELDHVAGDETGQREHDHGRDEERGKGDDEAPEDVGAHARARPRRPLPCGRRGLRLLYLSIQAAIIRPPKSKPLFGMKFLMWASQAETTLTEPFEPNSACSARYRWMS